MLQIKFKKCCQYCPYRKAYLNETNVGTFDGEIIEVLTTIGCEHEVVCKEYDNEKTDE